MSFDFFCLAGKHPVLQDRKRQVSAPKSTLSGIFSVILKKVRLEEKVYWS